MDPAARPIKRTALGRMTHEGAQISVAPDGRVVVFMGDDDDFEYLYRFVTEGKYNPTIGPPTRTCLITAHCRLPNSAATAQWCGCRLLPAKGL
jgi:hypothetical protein